MDQTNYFYDIIVYDTMTKSKSLRIFSFTMACLMLFVSSGFSLDVHYCDGQVKRANLVGKAKTCAEVEACMLKCGMPAMSCSKEASGCCDNQSFAIDFDFDSGEVTSAYLSPDLQKVVLAFVASSFLPLEIAKVDHEYTSYVPPPLIEDKRVLYQSFLC